MASAKRQKAAEDVETISCMPHPHTLTKSGDQGYRDSDSGRKAFPFALAEKIDNSISATKDVPQKQRVVDLYFLFSDANKVQYICIFDNGIGMNTAGLEAYATYNFSQASREKESSKDAAPPVSLNLETDSDPLSFNGHIGHFGVGAQNSAFYIANRELVVTKKKSEQVRELCLSEAELEEKWTNKRGEAYKLRVTARDPGGSDDRCPQSMKQHPTLEELWKREKEYDSFSLFVLADIKVHHRKYLEENLTASTTISKTLEEAPSIKDICLDLARVYHYYMAGPTGLNEDQASTDSDSSSVDDENESESDEEGLQPGRKRTRANDNKKPKLKRSKADPGRWSSCSDSNANAVNIFVHICKPTSPRITISLNNMHNADHKIVSLERLMMKKQKECFEFGVQFPLARGGQCKAIVRAYYFAKKQERETRPLDNCGEQDADGPIFCMYWQGRWIPYALAKATHFFDRVENKELLRRIRGTMFFPRAMLPANNKLSLMESPEIAMQKQDIRIYEESWEQEMQLKAFKNHLAKWLEHCHKQYDRDITFMALLGYSESSKTTHFERVKYGHRVYGKNDEVSFKKKGVANHIYGRIEYFVCDGNCPENHRSPTGKFMYKRHPLNIFGQQLVEENIGCLSSKPLSSSELTAYKESWQKKVDMIDKRTPESLIVLRGFDFSKAQDLKFKGRELQSSHPDAVAAKLSESAGWKLPELSVFIRAKDGKPVSSILTADKTKTLHVRQEIVKKTDKGFKGTDDIVGRRIHGGLDTTRDDPAKNHCYWFNSVAEAFDGAGTYDLKFVVPGLDITWEAEVTIKPSDIDSVEIQKPPQPIRLGLPQRDAFRICFRDKFKDKESRQETKGNVCFHHGQERPKDLSIEVLSIKNSSGSGLEKSNLSLYISSKTSDMGWFDVCLGCTLRDDQGPLKNLKKVKPEQVSCTVKIRVGSKIFSNQEFGFTLAAGKPERLSRESYPAQLFVENKTYGPEGIKIRVEDRWGHPVNVDEKGEPTAVQERMIYVGNDYKMKKRKEGTGTGKFKDLVAVKADAKCVANFPARAVFLENPPVTKDEEHALEYQIVGTGESITLPLTIQPSKLPHAVCVHLGKIPLEMIDDRVHVDAPAGSDVCNVFFRFADEASRPVEISKEDGWKVSWNFQNPPVALEAKAEVGFEMPQVKARVVAGDKDQYSITFRGSGKSQISHTQTITVTVIICPVSAMPHKWSCVSVETLDGAQHHPDRPIFVRCRQPLRDVLRLVLLDKFGNQCRISETAGLLPDVLLAGVKRENKPPAKEGDWDVFELVENDTDSFFQTSAGACFAGKEQEFDLLFTTRQPAPIKLENAKPKISLISGQPAKMRATLKGLPKNDAIDLIDKMTLDCPTAVTFNSISVQITDEWDNAVQFKNMKCTLQISNGILQDGKAAPSQSIIKMSKKDAEFRNIRFKAVKADSNEATLTVFCVLDDVNEFSTVVTLRLEKLNRIIAVEITPSADRFPKQFRAGDKIAKVLVNLLTEDGREYNGPYLVRNESITPKYTFNGVPYSVDLYRDPYREDEEHDVSNTAVICFQALQPLSQAGKYEMMFTYTENRDDIKANLVGTECTVNSDVIRFTVQPGLPQKLRILNPKDWHSVAGNGYEADKRCLASSPQLVVVDNYGNQCSEPALTLCVSMSLLLAAKKGPLAKNEDPAREISEEFEFHFTNDRELVQNIQNTRFKVEKLTAECQTKEQKLKEVKERAQRSDATRNEASRQLIQAYATAETVCEVSRSDIDSEAKIDHQIRQRRDQLEDLDYWIHPNVLDIKQRILQKFGQLEVVGLLGELIYFEDRRVADLVSWHVGTDKLQTIIVRQQFVAAQIGDRNGYDICVVAIEGSEDFPGTVTHDNKLVLHRSEAFRWQTDCAAVNLLRFYNPENEELRRNVCFTRIGRVCILNMNLHRASELVVRCRRQRERCPDLVTAEDGRRISSSGVMRGGASGGCPGRPNVHVGACDSRRSHQIHVLQQLREALTVTAQKRQACERDVQAAQHDIAAADQELAQLLRVRAAAQEEYNAARKKRVSADRSAAAAAAQGATGAGAAAAGAVASADGDWDLDSTPRGGSVPPELETECSLFPVEADGRVKLPPLRLREGVGDQEGKYVVRFQLMSTGGFPIHKAQPDLEKSEVGT